MSEKDENDDNNNNEENEDSNYKDDIIKFIEVNNIEEKNKIIKNKKNKDFIFCTISFKPVKTTPLEFIDTKEQLEKFINLISNSYNEIAIDLEHHSKESYLGITCLAQK